ncbi:hypothetical protein [Nonomuraea africana]|uniref:Uncharacterized protein n=1 Tax=Nonomuraea africana TaxID=46171 RepID=A0ABR9KC85_9ACTN|nr:hypothetical protein [Nonomuraea africana]MBE1559624.1 hypothetical protein [Nonomuraea africana]
MLYVNPRLVCRIHVKIVNVGFGLMSADPLLDALGVVAQLFGQQGDVSVKAIAGDQQRGDRVGAVGGAQRS